MKVDRFIFVIIFNDVIVADVSWRLGVSVTVAVFAHVERHLLTNFQQMRHDLRSLVLLQLIVVDGERVLGEVSGTSVGGH